MTSPVVARRKANALIADVEVAPGLAVPRQVESVLGTFRSAYGGLWVGGVVELRPDVLTFTPNAVNRAVQVGDLDLVVVLRGVTSVEVERGVLTRIIAIAVEAETLKIRCFKADELAEQIRSAVRATG